MGALDYTKNDEDTWHDPEGYDAYIQGELNSFRKQAWKDVLSEHIKPDAGLEILDLGCGPGFFSCILSELGHRVTGIDGSPGMLMAAEKNAEALGVFPKLVHKNYNELDFLPESFDAIVCRNVTWTMGEPGRLYGALLEILRPGGKFIIYDSNWYYHYLDPELDARVLAVEEEHERIYGVHRDIAGHIDENTPAFLERYPMASYDRPDWDRRMLESLGAEVSIRQDLSDRVYTDWEKQLYQLHRLFEICAVRQ